MKVMEPILANLALYHELIFVFAAFERFLTATVFVQECVVVDVLVVLVFFVVQQLARI